MYYPNQIFISPNNWFQLEYPKMWEFEVIENIPAFFDPINGNGALQIFSIKLGTPEAMTEDIKVYSFLKEPTLEDKMVSFLSEQEIEINPEKIIVFNTDPETLCLPYEYILNNYFFMTCMFQKNNIFLLTLYNCKGEPTNEEAKNIADIVRSIKIA